MQLESIKIEIKDLFEFLELDNEKYNETQETTEKIFIKTDNGDLTPILGYVKKQDKPIYKCTFEKGETIEVADTHIFRTEGKEIFAKDSKDILLDTVNGKVLCTSVEYVTDDDVYDITIDNPHWYTHDEDFCDGLISHNTMHLASYASNAILNGFNVAVITLEDGEFAWTSRIDVNLMNMNLDELKDKGIALESTFKSIMNSKMGKFKIKEFPSSTTNENNVKNILQEWNIKDNFVPDILLVDYVQIMNPVNQTNNSNTNETGKKVAEELRSLALEANLPIISAAQVNRAGFDAQYLSLTNVSDSIGLIMTCDAVAGITSDIDHPGKQFLSILKSRKTDKSKLQPTAVYSDIEHQRITDIGDKRSARVPKVLA